EKGGAQAGRIPESIEHIAANRDITDDGARLGAPFSGNGFAAARSVLVGEPSERGVARVEALALRLPGDDQAIGEGTDDEAALKLGRKDATGPTRPVLLQVIDVVLVGRTEQRPCDLAAPERIVGAETRPDSSRGKTVVTVVERIHVCSGERIEPVELGASG